ncbi:probable glucan 1,3-beta-glucosidase A isoform X3 [Phoenix dactylifera]|uniref:Probable glucan 1,3-beta-glucosidase A isoform X3 n=1 Tax=Phoenix dactylifera TaxID=42345 RepID=A0A8B8ZRU6_PHODC|nr:probable glucan 1,3-beta-glucosidase A isoform X3 [Phoenix dactylifera]
MPIMTCLHYWIWNKLGGKKDFFFASAEMGRWAFCVLILLWILFPLANSSVDGLDKVRGVNLGGWLVVEGWIKPSLFDGIPNRDMLDGTQVQFKSVTLQKYVSVDGGGGMNVTVDRDVASSWETFRATMNNQLTANYRGVPGWDDNAATFEMTIAANNLLGDYQLANGYGHDKAKEVLMKHQRSFITAGDFAFLSRNGINTVRIPVGWWIAQDPYPPAPFIGGSLVALDGAFSWAQVYNLKCIIDLHAAPGSQNGMEHSASRDGSVGWPSPDYISQTLDVIDFLSARYANHPALLGIELLNEPSAASVPLDVLVSYYMRGYQIVRNYSSEAYVIICQRIGNADPMELYQANIGDSNIVVDLHYYNLFDPYFDNMNAMENIQFIYESRVPQLQSLDSANGPLVYIGEWVNEWSVTNASQIQYQMYGSAQLQAYDAASFGWSYWTLKNDRIHWDFEWNIKNKYLLLGSGYWILEYVIRKWITATSKQCFGNDPSVEAPKVWESNERPK